MVICVNCGDQIPEGQDAGGPAMDERWCIDCFDGENIRSRDYDVVSGNVGGLLGVLQKQSGATARSRPPKYMLKKSEWAQYGY